MSLLHTDDVGAATLLSPTNYNDAIASFDQSCAVEDAGRQECRPSHDEDKNVLAPYVPREHFSEEAKAVMQAGRELWRYYHAQPNANPDASFYDIRLFFQGTKVTASGKTQMNPDSADVHYTALITELRRHLKALARQIEPKVYLYGFLKR